MQTIHSLIIDMDGVLWEGETPMPGLSEFFNTLQELELRFVLATNNATKVAGQYSEKLARFGLAVPAANILTSSEATAAYLRTRYPAGTRIYPVGEDGLRLALEGHGFDLLRPEDFENTGAVANVVVVGFTRHVTYRELAIASLLIHGGAAFVGTNPDVTFPSEYGRLPGAGAIQAFIQAATGVAPTIVGKPNRIIFEEALRRLECPAGHTAMVGDRLETDILGANEAGVQSVLLLTGVTGREQLANNPIQPDYVLADLPALTDFLRGNRG